MQIEIADISAIPLFNEDVEAEGWPPAIANLRQQVAASGALLISTPEYNYSLPGVLKIRSIGSRESIAQSRQKPFPWMRNHWALSGFRLVSLVRHAPN
jgi:NAD(P)H-dependent FMN reductase